MKSRKYLYMGAALAALLWGGTVEAATFVVDRRDDNAGATACTAAANDCSLRGAIIAANAAAGADVITLPGGAPYNLTITNAAGDEDAAATGDLDIIDDLTINGDGAATTIVDGQDNDRVFQIISSFPNPNFVVHLSNLTVRNGTTNPPPGFGTCSDGGGINNDGDLTLTRVVVTGNDTGPGGCNGGGIFNDFDSGMTMDESTISGNTASGEGGGLFDQASFNTGDRFLYTDSTISGNTAGTDGGGLYTSDDSTTVITTIVDTTFSGNRANGDGGGILICYGLIKLRNVTITGNTADLDADDSGNGGGVSLPDCGDNSLLIRNTIVAGNIDDSATTDNPDCFLESPSNLTSEDFNLVGDETGCDGLFTGTSDQVGTSGSPINPSLGPLADNGGPTFTHALLLTPVSPAIDAGNDVQGCTSDDGQATVLTRDQRNSTRPLDGGAVGPSPARCDIGAFELGGCGDGFLDPATEACDDGNTVAGDGCSPTCTLEACGNGTVDTGEACDDGNTVSGDGCSATCTLESCGNGTVDTGEQCDDGNVADGDGCSAACTLESCGNGVVDTGETCDDGNNVDTDACRNTCKAAACGDGVVEAGVEECDDGNTKNGDGCSSTCTIETVQLLVGGIGCNLIPEGSTRSMIRR